MSDIRDILRSIGGGSILRGAAAVAEATQRSDKPVKADSVYRWQIYGAPDTHWSALMALDERLTPEIIFLANVGTRARASAKRRMRGRKSPDRSTNAHQ